MAGRITKHKGKGGGMEVLPSRNALTRLVKGDPAQRSLNQYAKATPADVSGLNWPKQLPLGNFQTNPDGTPK